jgi:hypothetical protein
MGSSSSEFIGVGALSFLGVGCVVGSREPGAEACMVDPEKTLDVPVGGRVGAYLLR